MHCFWKQRNRAFRHSKKFDLLNQCPQASKLLHSSTNAQTTKWIFLSVMRNINSNTLPNSSDSFRVEFHQKSFLHVLGQFGQPQKRQRKKRPWNNTWWKWPQDRNQVDPKPHRSKLKRPITENHLQWNRKEGFVNLGIGTQNTPLYDLESDLIRYIYPIPIF